MYPLIEITLEAHWIQLPGSDPAPSTFPTWLTLQSEHDNINPNLPVASRSLMNEAFCFGAPRLDIFFNFRLCIVIFR